MPRVRIIKKNDEYSSEYDLGDIFEITGTWYGGVHIEGKSGVPVSDWTRMNIWNWTQNHRSKKIRQ